jgi:hypothetical protein
LFGGRERPGVNQSVIRINNRLHRFNSASDERGLHLADGIVDRGAPTFVEDLDAEDLASGSRAVFVRASDGDVERQNLIGIPRRCEFLVGLRFVDGGQINCIDRRLNARTNAANERRCEDSVAVGLRVLELRTNLVLVSNELAAGQLEETQESVAIEIDPDEGSGDAALVAAVCADVRAVERNLSARRLR